MSKTGIVRDTRYIEHRTGDFHPESHRRLEVIYEMLNDPDMADKYTDVPVREATEEELLYIHSKDYIDLVASTAGKPSSYLDADTQTSPGSYLAALLAAGGLLNAIKMVSGDELNNAFALVRPYPGSGSFNEVGKGNGEGYTVNVPLSTGYGDAEYIAIFQQILQPIAKEFKPDLVLASVGFDIFEGDPLGGMSVTPDGFAGLTRTLMEIARSSCDGKLVLTLEGGYNLQGLRDSVKSVLKELSGESTIEGRDWSDKENQRILTPVLDKVKSIQGRYWKI
jgi:acetoin utilization deacetylase AcuC-like enzyme